MSSSSNDNDLLVVKEKRHGHRRPVVRQDRIPVQKDETCYVIINGQNYNVINYSVFGVAIASNETIDANQEFKNIEFFFEGFKIGVFNLRFIRAQKTPDNLYYIAFSIEGNSLQTQVIDLLRKSTKIIKAHVDQIESEKIIPVEFRTRVFEAKGWLSSLKNQIDILENMIDKSDRAQLELIERTVTKVISNHLNTIFSYIFNDPDLKIYEYSDEVLRKCIKFFHNNMRDIIYKDPFTSRSFYKPLGYAGDYEMMNLIYRNEPAGENLFAKCLHFYWAQKPAAQAVRNRAQYLTNKIVQLFEKTDVNKTLRILSVASGPSYEVQHLISKVKKYNNRNAEFHMLDQDLNALKYAQRKIYEFSTKNNCNFDFNFHNLSIQSVVKEKLLYKDSCDLIYSAGLFDYFIDRIAKMTAQVMYNALKPGGSLIIGNFHYNNPAALEMKIALDWDLIHRSEDDLARLFGDLGGDLYVENEHENINLFCVVTKK